MGMNISRETWESLVIETQFATELAVTGLRRLCSVPSGPVLDEWNSYDHNYALHVGMSAYSSGLERLCKLAIACNGYATTGVFPRLRDFSHKIGDLLNAVGGLQAPESAPKPSEREARNLIRPTDALDPELMEMVERFANGAGRYEHLDALWNNDAEVGTFKKWVELAERASISEEVRGLISLRDAMRHALESELSEAGLESSAQSVLEDLEVPIFESSVGVVISLFRKIRWVSTVLNVSTYYTSHDLPILGEVINPTFSHTSTDFFNFHIAKFSDSDVVEEELQEVYPRILAREAEEDGEEAEDA